MSTDLTKTDDAGIIHFISLGDTVNTNLDYNAAANECARYIFDSDCEQISYQNYIEEGNDPRDHILYHAAIVLGQSDEFTIDIEEYEKEIANGSV